MLSRELNAATAKPAILAILAGGESYGYEIIRKVHALSEERIEWAEGALYPLLHRLEQEGLVESVVRSADNGRKRKYYRLKAKGKAHLAFQQKQWSVASSLLTKLWGPGPCLT